MNAVTPFTVIASATDFGASVHVSHDEEFIQVHLHTLANELKQFALRRPDRTLKHLVQSVHEVASLVSTPALEAWMLDTGFFRVK